MQPIYLYNSLSRQKELFKPLQNNKVSLYVCGITVYDYCHIGHARSMVVFDVIVRYLRACGYHVTFVRNITDIDDKIIHRARENGESVPALTERFIRLMHEDETALGVLAPDVEPRATEYIPQIVEMVQNLVDKGYAYSPTEGGDVYFDVLRFPQYGQLAGREHEHEMAGARVAVDENKRNPMDFVLWKHSKPGEPTWPSPWGEGRPGWHIECSAMSTHYLGNHFDIHGGGVDLKFPHHENEIAQSRAATGQPFANYWVHNGMITVDGKKMSKSEGNYHTVREVLATYRPEAVRYFFLTSHYASPLDYSELALNQAQESLTRMYLALRDVPAASRTLAEIGDADAVSRFHAAMSDDFNTAGALAVMFDVVRELNRAKEQKHSAQARQLAEILKTIGGVLGLLQSEVEDFLRQASDSAGVSDIEISRMVVERDAARKAKDFVKADNLRKQLSELGIVLEDNSGGTRWRRQ